MHARAVILALIGEEEPVRLGLVTSGKPALSDEVLGGRGIAPAGNSSPLALPLAPLSKPARPRSGPRL
jgi:hypothetical protein